MSKPEGMSDEEWDDELQNRMHEKWRQDQNERITREGFEIIAWDVGDADLCEYQKVVQVSPRKRVTQHYGKPSTVLLDLRGPRNPDGVKVAFCNECLAEHVRDLLRYLT